MNELRAFPELEFELPFGSDAFRQSFADLVEYRSRHGRELTPESPDWRCLREKLAAWGEQRSIAAIKESIANGYTGLVEPRRAPGNGRGSASRKTYRGCDAQPAPNRGANETAAFPEIAYADENET